jgi:hypothetical protein
MSSDGEYEPDCKIDGCYGPTGGKCMECGNLIVALAQQPERIQITKDHVQALPGYVAMLEERGAACERYRDALETISVNAKRAKPEDAQTVLRLLGLVAGKVVEGAWVHEVADDVVAQQRAAGAAA